EDGIRDFHVTGVQTCALPIYGYFSNIIQYAREHYDYILVDTAPVGLVTDTVLIAEHADMTIYVMRANYLDKRLLNIPKELYEERSEERRVGKESRCRWWTSR